jgi:hypothetical protein
MYFADITLELRRSPKLKVSDGPTFTRMGTHESRWYGSFFLLLFL